MATTARRVTRTPKQVELMRTCETRAPLFGAGEYANARRLQAAGVLQQIVEAGCVYYVLTEQGRDELANIDGANQGTG